MEFNSGFCKSCDTQKKIERSTPNHILHLLIALVLGLFTFGIGAVVWIVIWLLSSIRFGGWRCSTCGSTDITTKVKIPYLYIGIGIIIVWFSVYAPGMVKDRNSNSNSLFKNQTVKQERHEKVDMQYAEDLRAELSEYINGPSEPTIKDSAWNGPTLSIGVLDDGSNRNGFAQYICAEINSGRYEGIYGDDRHINVVIRDINTYKKLGDEFCKQSQ